MVQLIQTMDMEQTGTCFKECLQHQELYFNQALHTRSYKKHKDLNQSSSLSIEWHSRLGSNALRVVHVDVDPEPLRCDHPCPISSTVLSLNNVLTKLELTLHLFLDRSAAEHLSCSWKLLSHLLGRVVQEIFSGVILAVDACRIALILLCMIGLVQLIVRPYALVDACTVELLVFFLLRHDAGLVELVVRSLFGLDACTVELAVFCLISLDTCLVDFVVRCSFGPVACLVELVVLSLFGVDACTVELVVFLFFGHDVCLLDLVLRFFLGLDDLGLHGCPVTFLQKCDHFLFPIL